MADRVKTEREDDIKIENTEELNKLVYSGEEKVPIFSTVRVTKKDFSVFELYRKYQKKKLILEVDFQRREVWEGKQKHELIESILMGLPLPIFYFKQQDNATYVVVDGKQRLSALFEYLNDDFALKGLKILHRLNGRRFSDLTGEFGIYQSQLEDYQVYSHVILPPTPDKILFDIFDRVNRGGTQLNKQEIRNALYHGKGLNMIDDLTKSDVFVQATRIKHEKDSRMKGSYLLTRFFSFYLLLQGMVKKEGKAYEYNGNIDDLIEEVLTQLNQYPQEELEKLKKIGIKNLQKSYDILGEGAFRRELNRSKPLNMNLFETIMYLMSMFDEIEISSGKQEIRDKIYKKIVSDEYLSCIGDSRDNTQKVYKRFDLMEELAGEIKNDSKNSC